MSGARMTRREFVGGLIEGSLVGGAAAALAHRLIFSSDEVFADTRPNIVFAISDDISWAHKSAYGDPVASTSAFDRVAGEGVRFTRAFCSCPSCSPSRAAVLSGQDIWRLGEAANLRGTLYDTTDVYTILLQAAGYFIGSNGKAWAPATASAGGWSFNPAGPRYSNFKTFLDNCPADTPFCFWQGSSDAHRPYTEGSGLASGKRLEDVQLPPFLPDDDQVRSDILDYYFEVERFDSLVGSLLTELDNRGLADNTIVVVTSDNGWPFPRSKTTLYDYGTRMPLAIRWPARVPGGRSIDDFVNLVDLAPTFLEAAGSAVPAAMSGRSLLSTLTSGKSGRVDPTRDKTFFGLEYHANARELYRGYPARAVRTDRYLYIRNFEPDRWPAGDPENYRDVDDGPTKSYMLANREVPEVAPLFELAFGKRPPEELYDLAADPYQMNNLAFDPAYASAKASLSATLMQKLVDDGDPHASGDHYAFDRYPIYNSSGRLDRDIPPSRTEIDNRIKRMRAGEATEADVRMLIEWYRKQ